MASDEPRVERGSAETREAARLGRLDHRRLAVCEEREARLDAAAEGIGDGDGPPLAAVSGEKDVGRPLAAVRDRELVGFPPGLAHAPRERGGGLRRAEGALELVGRH